MFRTSIVELDAIAQAQILRNHNSYAKSFKLIKYLIKQDKTHRDKNNSGGGKHEISMVKKIYLRCLVNLAETFTLKIIDDKYFMMFKDKINRDPNG